MTSPTVQVTIQTSPTGRSFTVDGTTYSTTQTLTWTSGSNHTIATTSPQSGGTGTQYVWSNWSDGGAISHSVAPTSNTTYTANFTTQYYLTMNAGTGGTVSPSSNWYNSGQSVQITATANSGYVFSNWTGSGSGSYTGTSSQATVTMNGPITETANFTPSTIPVTVQMNPQGRSFTVDGTPYTTTQTFSWVSGSSHTLATTTPQSGGTGTQYVWSSWSDGGAISHTVSPTSNTTYTANFTTQYYLTMNAGTGGTISPSSNWYNSGQSVPITATPNSDYFFSGWTGSGSGSYTGTNNPANVTMNGPITETANFTQLPVNIQVTVQTSPTGRSFTVDGTTYTTTQTLTWTSGSNHTIATTSPQSGDTGIQYVWNNWSDNGAISHTVSPTSNTTYTANFTTQYYLTMNAGTGGTVSPSSDWYTSGQSVPITATPNSGYVFSGWTGSGSGSYTGTNNPANVTMNGPIAEMANFTQSPATIQVTVQTSPTGRSFTVDGTPYTTTQTLTWTSGSSHTIATTSPQSGDTGIQYVWSSWSDSGTISHTVSPTSNATYTANFTPQYYLTMTAGSGGSVSPSSGWYESGQSVQITATPNSGYDFSGWTGSGSGSYTGINNPANVTMNGPITETAVYATSPIPFVSVNPAPNALNVNKATNITMTFTQDINPVTLTNGTIKVNGSQSGLHISSSITYNSGTRTATFNPDTDFSFGEVVTVTLTAGIQSTSGAPLTPYTWSFTVGVNAGTGVFGQANPVGAGSSANIGDFDADGDLDLAVMSALNTLSILKNNGSGVFSPYSSLSLDSGFGVYSATGDFDGDGDIDLVANVNSSVGVSILKNDGTGNFTQGSVLNFGSELNQTFSGDFDGDGDLDVAVHNYLGNVIFILKNDGSGNLSLTSTPDLGSGLNGMTTGDFDGDGDLDLAVAKPNNGVELILKNGGSGNFTLSSTVNVGALYPNSQTAGDFDGDGDLDIAIAKIGSNNMVVLENDGNGNFTIIPPVGVGGEPRYIASGDFDADGDLDLAVGNTLNLDSVSILRNDGNLSFIQTAILEVGVMGIGDIDGDGDLDLVVADANPNTISILKNTGVTPTLAIVSPTPNQVLPAGTTQTTLTVNIANHTGHWHWQLNTPFPNSGPAGGNPVESGNTATITGLANGQTYTAYATLVDSNHNVLNPPVTASVTFSVNQGGNAGWTATMTATSNNQAVSPQTRTFGMNTNGSNGFDSGFDVSAPPPPNPPILLDSFFPLAGDPFITRLSTDIRAITDSVTWTFKVQADIDGFTLSWDISAIPVDYASVTLKPPSGNAINMRTQTQASFAAGTYVFQIMVQKTMTVSIQLKPGWNMISIPGTPVNSDPASLVGQGSQILLPLYRWNPSGFSYVAVTQLKLGEGYWILTINPNGETVQVPVIPASTYTASLPQGWNMIGSVSGNADFSNPQDNPDGSILLPAYGWNPTGFAYVPASTFEPGKGYWVLSPFQPCTLTVTATPPSPPSAPAQWDDPDFVVVRSPAFHFPLRVENSHHRQQLVLGWDEAARADLDGFDSVLPPTPPVEGILDAHFESSSFRLQQSVLPPVQGATWILRIATAEPVTVRWNKAALPERFMLIAQTSSGDVDFRETDFLALPKGEHMIPIRLTLRALPPRESKLFPNFPNPFNPETWLPYQLAEGNHVEITIYNVNGEKVRTLSFGFKPPGYYLTRDQAAYWDGRNENSELVASGVYFYTLHSGKFTATRKLLILK